MKIFRQLMLSAMLAGTAVPVLVYGQQKPALDFKDCRDWPYLAGARGISANGDYVYYEVDNEKPGVKVIHVRSVDGKWHQTFEKKADSWMTTQMSADGKLFLMQLPGDILKILTLGTEQQEQINGVSGFETLSNGGKEWLIYQTGNKVTFRNLATSKESSVEGVASMRSSERKNYVLLLMEQPGIKLFNTKSGQLTDAWKGNGNVTDVRFDDSERSMAIVLNNNDANAIWWYDIGGKPAVKLLDDANANLGSEFKLNAIGSIIASGDCIEFNFTRAPKPAEAKKLAAGVNVYTYMDTISYTEQMSSGFGKPREQFKGIYNRKTDKVVFREGEFDMYNTLSNSTGELGMVSYTFQAMRALGDQSMKFVDTRTGEKFSVGKGYRAADYNWSVSPSGRYVMLEMRDGAKIELVSFDKATRKLIPVTEKLPVPQKDMSFRVEFLQRFFKLSGWIKGTDKALVADNFDIWEVDMSGKQPPVSITNGYGRKHKTVFAISCIHHNLGARQIDPAEKKLIMTTYNYNNGDNDLYSIDMTNHRTNPKRLTSGGYMHEHTDAALEAVKGGSYTAKASKADVYFLMREKVSESPNIFITKDFKEYTNVTNLYPEKKFNWVTAELTDFVSADGRPLKGILYKPENFDPRKKYPVIFYFYLTLSTELHHYETPELSGAVINIPYYASNDYLVFTPDIEVEYKGRAAEMALNSILGAADAMSKLPYVDSTKMAIHGHSWGGYECNYMVTHTDRFAAAISASGGSDNIGAYGLPTHGGIPNFYMSYDNAGGNLLDKLNVYIENSAKVYASKVTTPLLIMHNRKDNAVRFEHSEGFFFYLWQLGKRAWMLEYDNEDHVIDKEENRLDYSIRMKQFLDHYLKGQPAPVWMTRGLPYRKKGYENGYQLDQEIKTPVTKK